ncbi:MAG: metalloregulator ArsR/SmtB family transcription factor [Sphingomicrobium sp.]
MNLSEIENLAEQSTAVAALLRAIANQQRLLILCYLAAAGEMSAGEFTKHVGLSQSALSQHLARLRADGLVTTRKQAQLVFYRIAEPKVLALLNALQSIFCPALNLNTSTESDNDRPRHL